MLQQRGQDVGCPSREIKNMFALEFSFNLRKTVDSEIAAVLVFLVVACILVFRESNA